MRAKPGRSGSAGTTSTRGSDELAEARAQPWALAKPGLLRANTRFTTLSPCVTARQEQGHQALSEEACPFPDTRAVFLVYCLQHGSQDALTSTRRTLVIIWQQSNSHHTPRAHPNAKSELSVGNCKPAYNSPTR